MYAWFVQLHPVYQAFIATCFTWGVTSLGAGAVFLNRRTSRRLLDTMLGFSGGVMVAASYWSLLAPAIEVAKEQTIYPWLVVALGFLLGAICIWMIDKILPHLHLGFRRSEAEGIQTNWQRSLLLMLAITLHNIPEGLAVGVAFGGVVHGLASSDIASAIALAFGIGIQNFPEGFAISMPLRQDGMGRFKSFWWGQLSAAVEPLAGVLGAAAVIYAAPMLPYALAFAAGAMIYVVVEELVPESQRAGNTDLATMSFITGFMVMMMLDVALG